MHVQRCCFAKCKSIAFLPFSLPSPTLFLKLTIVVIQKCCYHVVLPHAQLKTQLHDLLKRIFILKEKASLLPIIFPPSGGMIRRQRGTRTSPVESLVSLLTFLSTTSTFVLEARFSGRLLVYPWAPTVHLCWLISSFIPLSTILWSKQ